DNPMRELSPEYIAYTNAHEILAITGTCFALATIVVLLRSYVRLAMLKVFGKDDYVIVLAMALATITFACFVFETHYGLGKHFVVVKMDADMYKNFSKTRYIHNLTIMFGVSCVKISVDFALLRFSSSKGQRRFLWGTISFICTPVQAAWDFTLRPVPLGTGHAKCFSNTEFRNIGLMNSLINIITGVLFATLPIPLVWRLQINKRTKISLIVVLSLGWFACVAGIIKAARQYNFLNDLDRTVHDTFTVWNYIELTIEIAAASLPPLRPLLNWILSTARAISSGTRTKGTGRRS
ncbi:hypothetical protein BU23DRAFT_448834, partial [Bimuria novae-zelandiae CBS 107.79]